MNLDGQAKAPVMDGAPHALIRYEDGTVEHVCIEECYGVHSYIQILDKDCEQLSCMVASHSLPALAFERASRPGLAWELEVTGLQVPKLVDINWISRYAPVVASERSESSVLNRAVKKVLRTLMHFAGGASPFKVGAPAPAASPQSLPGMRVPMKSSYLPMAVDRSGTVQDDLALGLLPAAGHGESAVILCEWPLISVVTVSFNQCNFLRECLDSVLEQNYPNLEFVVIDGGSTDGSREILEYYRHRLSHLVIEPDRGQSHALNKGFQLATGDVLTWLCSDDRLEPGALEIVANARSIHGSDIVSGGCRVIDAYGATKLIHYSGFLKGRQSPLSFGDMASFTSTWQKGLYFYQPELFFTRDLWNRAGSHVKEHLHYAMDYELFLRFALSGARLYAVERILGCSRQHEDQKTRHDVPMYLPTVRRILSDFREKLFFLQ